MGELDGARAVAILWVALFHFAVFWTPSGEGLALVPYGDLLSGVPLAAMGGYGVMLFFVISGAVIAMSLDRSPGALAFARARAARLVPTMAVCSAATFMAVSLLGPEEIAVSVPEWLISALFVPPAHVGRLLGIPDWSWLDGAYWSLWVEVRFYAVAALLVFGLGRGLLSAWCGFAALSGAVHVAGLAGSDGAEALSRLLFAYYQPYFTVGIALAALRTGGGGSLACGALFAGCVQAAAYTVASTDAGELPQALAACAFALALPSLAMLRPGSVAWLGCRPLAALGRASYGYYLLHQNLGLALLCAVPLAGWWSVGWMMAVQAALIGAALVIHRTIETPAARLARPRRATGAPRADAGAGRA